MDPRKWFGRPAAKVAPRVRLAAPAICVLCHNLLVVAWVGVPLGRPCCACFPS